MLMQSLNLYENETEHTSKNSQVYIENNKVYQLTYSYRDLHNQEQVNRVIERLVIEDGFVLETDKNQQIRLTNPLVPEIEYTIWTDSESYGITKRTNTLVGSLE